MIDEDKIKMMKYCVPACFVIFHFAWVPLIFFVLFLSSIKS